MRIFRNSLLFALIVEAFRFTGGFALEVDQLMPKPASLELGRGQLKIRSAFRVEVVGAANERIYPEATRFLRRLDRKTGLFIKQDFVDAEAADVMEGLVVKIERPASLKVGEDESYLLSINSSGAIIEAVTDLGALHAFETLLQLVSADSEGYFFPEVKIIDSPRFKWRGLMIDSSRHFMPVEVLKRNLDGMASVKMNVLHWHLSDNQGFRVESKIYPKLHELASDGFYYTQEQIREVVEYAGQRGIRVYPEFDVPGHATSWLVAYPELGSAPGPYTLTKRWGVLRPTLNPALEETYEFLDKFFGEMVSLFPDEYFHIGGDEVVGRQWDNNPEIQSFMREKGISDNHALQNYFNERVLGIVTKYGKKMIGWDEILQDGMPKSIVIQSWQGIDSMERAAKLGISCLLSSGYYIDLMQPASFHYLNDPIPVDSMLSAREKELILGGEATMWSEFVTPENIDSRIWPRTAAIAERLWSPQEVRDVNDMYRRLDTISLELEELGLLHELNREMMMRRLARGRDIEPLRTLIDVIEPLKIYARHKDKTFQTHSPYVLLPDIAGADALDARRFQALTNEYLKNDDLSVRGELEKWLEKWRDNHERYVKFVSAAPALKNTLPLSNSLREISLLGLAALRGEEISKEVEALFEASRQPVAKVELQIVDSIEKLVESFRRTRSE